jgi:rSAM/selenodomain-associated transferase 1
MSGIALVIMARYPEAGKTKTRLAHAIGNEQSARLYHAFLRDLARRFFGQRYRLHWAYTPPEVDYQAFVSTLIPNHSQPMTCFAQQGSNFAARLLHAFQWTSQHGFDRTILIGSDSPQISLATVEKAINALEESDVVLGPADDGGYYLIGMRGPHDVFSGIPMSTSIVLQMTIEAAQQQGLIVRQIDPLFDIDELPDLLRLARLLETDSTLAPATAIELATIRSVL